MNEMTRRLRGKIRQSRSEKYMHINDAVNLTTEYIFKYYENRLTFLSRPQVEEFELLILSTQKDLELALLNARNMLNLYPSQIRSVKIITQEPTETKGIDPRISLIHEVLLLQNQMVLKTCSSFGERSNWIKQQYLKMKYVSDSDIPVLIIDADTFLSRQIFLFSENSHTLLIGREDFHYAYTANCRKYYGTTQPLLNFVNHLQVQVPSYYHSSFTEDFDSAWVRWAVLGHRYGEDSPISEFQTYASAVLSSPEQVPIIVTLLHETKNVENMTIDDFENILKNFQGDLLTVGNKLLIRS